MLCFVCSLGLEAKLYLSFCCAVVLGILMRCSDDIQKSFLPKSLFGANPEKDGKLQFMLCCVGTNSAPLWAMKLRYLEADGTFHFFFFSCSTVYCAKFKANLCFIPYLSFTLTLCINTIKAREIHQKRDIHVCLISS